MYGTGRRKRRPGAGLFRRWGALPAALLAAVLLASCMPVEPPVVPDRSSPAASSRRQSSPASSAPVSSEASEASESAPPPAPPPSQPDSPPAASPSPGSSHSSYGRSTLPPACRAAYDAMAEGLMNREERISLSLPNEDALTETLQCVRRDYPSLSWLENQYTYEMDANTTITCIYPRYTKTKAQIAEELAQVDAAARELLANIDPSLPDFDRALLVHDRLCGHVTYDLSAPNQRELYGALCDGRATCDGYAKAYQYLLCRLGIEALIVYGEAEEPHAWNIVKLNGRYYQADPTWGDARLSDGTVFLSHAYLFLDDSAFSRSHTPYGGEHNYPLPACRAMEENYFVKTETDLNASSPEALTQALRRALDRTVAEGYDAVQIRFGSPEVEAACRALIDSGRADQILQQQAALRERKAMGRSYFEDAYVLTYLLA